MKSKLPDVFRNIILKDSEYPQKIKIIKTTFCWIAVFAFRENVFLKLN